MTELLEQEQSAPPSPFMRDRQTVDAMSEQLIWFPAKGYGFCPVPPAPDLYGDDYFEEYQRRAATPVGKGIAEFRVDLVDRYWNGKVLDVGIGCGAFIEARNRRMEAWRNRTVGYDVNPRGIDWLKRRSLWMDWNEQENIEAITLWDVLEHLPDPHELLDKVAGFAFVTIPIFESADHALRSRHWKPGEHLFYFTRKGFYGWAEGYGFEIYEETWMESCLFKRDSVASFVLKRS